MKIVLAYFRENYTPAPPMGILYLGSVLKAKGHTVKVIDSFPVYHDANIREIKEFEPDLIGLSVLTTGYRIAVYYTAILKKQNPKALICWGGVHPTALAKEVLLQQGLDFVVKGEGEETLVEVCKHLEEKKGLEGIKGLVLKSQGRILEGAPRGFIQDLDTLPVPDRTLLQNPRFSWYLSPPGIIRGYFLKGITTFYTSRGCPYSCIFCCSHNTAGRHLRQRSVPNVMEEINYLVRDFNVRGLYFNDDTFGLDKVWLEDFCNQLHKSRLKLVWGCQTRANVASADMFKMMKSCGCIQVDIGAESGSDRILKNLNKGITVQDIEKAFRYAQEAGLKTFATFILGSPGETLEDIRETDNLARKISAKVSFLILVPYPGSEVFEMAKENRWFVDEELHFSEDWTNKQSERPVMEINLKSAELLRLRARLQNSFLWRNNGEILMSFFMHPVYLLRICRSILRHFEEVFSSLLNSIKQKKSSIILETVYQKFNEDSLG